MESKSSKPKGQICSQPMKRSSSSSDSYHEESPHSPLRFHSPLRSDLGDPPDTPPYSSPINSPPSAAGTHPDPSKFRDKYSPALPHPDPYEFMDKYSPARPPPDPSKFLDKYSPVRPHPDASKLLDKYSPALSPLPALAPKKAEAPAPEEVAVAVVASVSKAEGTPTSSSVRKVGPERPAGTAALFRRSRKEDLLKIGEFGLRISEIVFSLVSFSVMAADKTQGWSGDSFDRYKEYRYCLSVNVIAFVYSSFQAYDLGYYIATGKHVIRHHLRRHFNFLIDQILAYLLLSASSSAATRVNDWQLNWGKDDFTEMASASVAMSFLAFFAFAGSSVISGYNFCNYDAT